MSDDVENEGNGIGLFLSTFVLGALAFLVGFYYVGKGKARQACDQDPKPKGADGQVTGGLVGVIIGMLLLIIAFFLKISSD
jgi:hypothetical protein